jgi:hypothetical protein
MVLDAHPESSATLAANAQGSARAAIGHAV